MPKQEHEETLLEYLRTDPQAYDAGVGMEIVEQVVAEELDRQNQEWIQFVEGLIDHELYILGKIQSSTGGRKYVKPQALSLMNIKKALKKRVKEEQ